MPPAERTPWSAADPSAASRNVVHLTNPLWDDNGGSDWRTIEMFRLLSERRQVYLWSGFTPAPEFRRRYPVRQQPAEVALPRPRAFDPTPSQLR